MIVFYKVPYNTVRINSLRTARQHRRINKTNTKKIKKNNKDFLQALGFKI